MSRIDYQAITSQLPIGRTLSEDNVKRIIANSLFAPQFSDAPQLSAHDKKQRVRLVDAALRALVNANVLSEVHGTSGISGTGYVRGNDRQAQSQTTFVYDGQIVTCNAADYDQTVARMKAERLTRSPQEATRLRLEQLEQEIEALKAGI
jgi:hypothetical protein